MMFDWRDYELRAKRFERIFNRRDDTARKVKHKEPNMDHMTKNVRAMGEHEYTRIVADYAKRLYPELTRERAFAKIFTEDSDEARAIRKMWQVSKGSDRPLNAVDEPDDDEDDDEDALEELNRLAEEQRRRENGMTKEAAFVKVYLANPKLAAKERQQNRPR